MSNTGDCWLAYVPSNIIIFVVMHIIFRMLNHFKVKFRERIISFQWPSVLIASIIMQNIQFISFRSFQQIKFGGSPLAQPNLYIYILNYTICYLSLFFVSTYSCCGYLILRILLRNNINCTLETVSYCN